MASRARPMSAAAANPDSMASSPSRQTQVASLIFYDHLRRLLIGIPHRLQGAVRETRALQLLSHDQAVAIQAIER